MMVSRALVFLTLAALAFSANALVTCPAASTSAIQCYQGLVYSGSVPAGGGCDCTCYPTQSTQSPNQPDTFTVTSAGACTTAACSTQYPSDCPANSYQRSASYDAFTDTLVTPQLAPAAANSICLTYTDDCRTNPGDCLGLSTGTITMYSTFQNDATDGTAAQQCGSMATMMNGVGYPGITLTSLCNTNACNAPSTSSSAPTPTAFFAALAAALAAAVLL